MVIKCPICSKKMDSKKTLTFNKENNAYKKTTYHCLNDDVWIVVEIPEEVLSKLL